MVPTLCSHVNVNSAQKRMSKACTLVSGLSCLGKASLDTLCLNHLLFALRFLLFWLAFAGMLILHLTGSPGFSFEILHLEPLPGRMNMMMLEKNCASFIWLPAHLSFLTSACIPCCLTVCFTSGHMQPFVCLSLIHI